jgi:solute carrier family 25 carnitine/acylcarnitine transporter 20/29
VTQHVQSYLFPLINRLGSLSFFKKQLNVHNHRQPYYKHAIAGLGAGLCVCLVATPIEVVKARLQVQYDAATRRYTGPVHCVFQTVKNRGILGLWQGFAACCLFRSFFWVLWSSFAYYSDTFEMLAKR